MNKQQTSRAFLTILALLAVVALVGCYGEYGYGGGVGLEVGGHPPGCGPR